MTTALLPCKKCGGPAKCFHAGPTRSEYSVKARGFTLKPGTWVGFCNDTPNCAIGPHAETDKAAREAWNRECGQAALEDSYATVGHAVHRGIDTRDAPVVDPHAVSMPILDTFIASALKELDLAPFIVLPECRLEHLKTIMLHLMSLRSLVKERIP